MTNFFSNYPDSARLWAFALARELGAAERALVTKQLDEFTRSWTSHGQPVHGAYEILENRFVLIAGYVGDGVSGCSTDSMVRVMTSLKKVYGIDGFDRTLVFFRKDGQVRAVTREGFRTMVDAGEIRDDTAVFDATIQTVGDLRAGRFETTFARAWHASAFTR